MKKSVFTILIVIFACAITWWSSWAESGVNNHIRHEIVKLVPQAHNNPAIVEPVVTNPLLIQPLQKSLEHVYSKSIKINLDYQIIITSGDDKKYGDGQATHVALIKTNNEPVVKYRVICNSKNSKIQIAGIIQEGIK